ncbi:RES domain-containing protein [Bacillus spizizenii]|nr:RES domain-containing protein [Bacillus spizizenii]
MDLYRKAKRLKKELSKHEEINDSLKELAFDIFKELTVKPEFTDKNTNDVIGEEKINTSTFSNKERLDILIEWTIEIDPILSFIIDKCDIPIERTGGDNLDAFMENVYTEYIEELHKLPNRKSFDSSKITKIESFAQQITKTIELYLDGYVHLAYAEFDKGMKIFSEEVNIEELLLYNIDSIRIPCKFFRMRTSNTEVFSKDDMFHIPFEKRGIIRTNRFSIPGFPCLYLGSSSLVCWEELGRPDLNTTYTSVFHLEDEDIKILDLSVSPKELADNLKKFFEITFRRKIYKFNAYFMTWILISACLIRVKKQKDIFKPEYIIPQFLLEWVKQPESSEYWGICYLSSKINRQTIENYKLYKNYAIPVRQRKDSGHCSLLGETFQISDPVAWETFQSLKDSPESLPFKNPLFPETEGTHHDYHKTELGRLEAFLIRYRSVVKDQL